MLAAEAVYGLQEAAVEVGAPPHPGLLGPDVPPHYSAIPAAAAAAAAAQQLDEQLQLRHLDRLAWPPRRACACASHLCTLYRWHTYVQRQRRGTGEGSGGD